MIPMHSVSLITPVFNEEDIIESAIRANIQVLESNGVLFEMIIVNDCSTDTSGLIIEKLFGSDPRIRISHHKKNQGFGGAVRTGIALSSLEYIFCIPADSPLDQAVFSAFCMNMDKADILVSYRIRRLGYNWWMRFNSTAYHILISLLFGMRLKDYNWIHMYHCKIFKSGVIRIEYDGIFMLAEVLIKADRKGYSFIEFPVDQKQRLTGIASVSKLSNILKTFIDVMDFFFKSLLK